MTRSINQLKKLTAKKNLTVEVIQLFQGFTCEKGKDVLLQGINWLGVDPNRFHFAKQ